MAKMPAGQLWAVLFFFMLLCLGLNSQVNKHTYKSYNLSITTLYTYLLTYLVSQFITSHKKYAK